MNTQQPIVNPNFMDDNSNLDLKREVNRYLRYWPWFVGSLLFALSVSFIYLRYTPRIYKTSAKVKILDESEGLELPTSAFVFRSSNINLENETTILKSYRIAKEVVRKLKLNTTFFEEGQLQTSQLAMFPFHFEQLINVDSINSNFSYEISINENNIEVYNAKIDENIVIDNHDSYFVEHNLPFQLRIDNQGQINRLIDKKYIVKFRPLKSTALSLRNRFKVEAIGDLSDIIEISYSGESTMLSEAIVDTLISTFNNDGIKDRQLVSKRTLDFIDERFIYLASELDSIELDRKEFKQDNNIVDLTVDADMALQQRTLSDEEVFKVENQIALAELIKETLNTSNSNLLPANVGLDNNEVNNLINEYNSSILQREKLITSAGINNPSVGLLNSTLNDLKKNLDLSLDSYQKQLEVSRNQLQLRNERFTGQVSQIPEKEKLLRAIERQQKIKESLYLLLLQKREEAAINLAITEPSIKVVEYALSGSKPISPKSNIVYAGAILGGLLVPFGVFFLIFMLDTKLHTKEDLANVNSTLSIIAEIPSIRNKEETIFDNPNSRSVLAESFRILSSNVNFLLPERTNCGQTIFCTSTIKGEGKTYISVNLSLALSSLNKRVLLIGADLRNPQIHTHINYDKNQKGLTNYMHESNIDWKDLIIKGFDKHDKHDTIISGAIPPNPAHLLTNGKFEQLIEEAKKEYDYVIVDTAPTILVTDTMLISKLADATLYIIRANFTDKNLLSFSQDLSDANKLNNMAYVLNGVGASKSYGYKYNYGYGYGYGSKE